MQQTFLNERTHWANGTACDESSTEYVLNVALVYQDSPTRQWAREVRDRMAETAGKEAIHCTDWNISDLRESKPFSEGVTALASADVIVVSLHEAERLPPAFFLWVNLWLQVRCGRPGALAALILPAAGLNSGANETRRYLCAVANQGRLDLLENNRPGEPIPGLAEGIFPWAKAA